MAVLNSLGVSGRTAGPSTAGRSGAAVRVAGCSVEIVIRLFVAALLYFIAQAKKEAPTGYYLFVVMRFTV